MAPKIISERFDVKDNHTFAVYSKNGGYGTLKKLFAMKPDDVIEEVKKSGLRGRGGAGFPTGMKWSFIPKSNDKPKYLCVNADEGEPGTFKDRLILERDPHALIEGIIICCFAVGIKNAYIYIRGEYDFPLARLSAALEEAYREGYVGKNIKGSGMDLEIVIHRGAGAYICGDETGLIESLEGKKGQPRPKPPFPAIQGVFDCPTVVNNVETISALPWIMQHGADAYAAIGTEKSKGTMLFSISGMVERPGVYESAFGVNLWDFIESSTGGVKGGKKLKAVIPGGSSSAILTAEEARNVKLDYESIAATGAMVGSGAIMVIDEDTSIVKALEVVLRFYAHESCGQCPPCREGTYWLYEIVHRICEGKGRPEDIDLLLSICPDMMGRTICVLADSAAIPAASYIKKFRPEFEAMINRAGAPERHLHPGGVNLESRAL
ncbi:MAG TPA: NADH-quinone oxidoreductase subunit NuoF [Candidatus Krumholzibacteria bacterium]|nr:NADH-quinone oxidoreductase subunit NuoF [Candidatus Krumholzibacteria bacterium]